MYEQWHLMEKFYYEDLGVIVAIFIVFSILSVSTISHLSYLFPKVVNGLFLIFILTSGLFIYQNYQVHGDLMAKAKYVNPANRDFKRNFYRDQDYSSYEKELYRNDYMGNYFNAIGLYDTRKKIEKVTFLGRDSLNYLYFEVDGTIYLTIDKWVQFSEEDTQASRVGVHYQLSDAKLTELGFVSESRVFFQHFIVPSSLKKLDYQAAANVKVHQHRDIVAKWVAPS